MSTATASRHSARASRALQRLAEADPAFAALSLWVHHRDGEDNSVPAPPPAWTDGKTIFYGPGFVALTDAEQMGVAAHHLAHVAFGHVGRARRMHLRFGAEHDQDLFNLAADAVVNGMLICAGYVLPRPCPEVNALVKTALQDSQSPSQAVTQWDVERLYVALRAASDGPSQARQYGETASYTADLHTQGAEAGQPDAQSEEEAPWEAEARLRRALADGRAAGRGIGALGMHLADLPRTEVPWERHLRRLVSRTLSPDPGRSWARPMGRWLASEAEARAQSRPVPVFEPGRRRDRGMPVIAVAVDCSSSVDRATLRLFAAQIAGIGRRVGGMVQLLAFDDAVLWSRGMQGGDWTAEIARLEFARDGGTNYWPVFAAAQALRPSVLVMLTDLLAPLPDPPEFPVVWTVPARVPAPAYGALVVLDR